MAANWREVAGGYFPEQEFDTALALYLHAAHLIIDHGFEATVRARPGHGGVDSSYVANLMGTSDEEAPKVALRHMALTLGMRAYLTDVRDPTADALGELIGELFDV